MEKKEENKKPPVFDDYDAVVFRLEGDGICMVSPYDTKTGKWIIGMTLLTSIEKVAGWEVIMIPESIVYKAIKRLKTKKPSKLKK